MDKPFVCSKHAHALCRKAEDCAKSGLFSRARRLIESARDKADFCLSGQENSETAWSSAMRRIHRAVENVDAAEEAAQLAAVEAAREFARSAMMAD